VPAEIGLFRIRARQEGERAREELTSQQEPAVGSSIEYIKVPGRGAISRWRPERLTAYKEVARPKADAVNRISSLRDDRTGPP
jgi:hypothetical protein